jgi:hypothetical protein
MRGEGPFVFPVFSLDPPRLSRHARLLDASLQIRRWEVGPWYRLDDLISEDPTLRATIAGDPRFAALMDFYQFRVLVGLERPRRADGVQLPGSPEAPRP